ncbi:Pkinase-domain-containing protein [Histomonas meleagridis]|uniref:Pkinase-domain-containing protein n=1 Tax=Histomonas meleagridis TaxID=135588 RepID=UPI0035593798|nr:Pkinase-domain-containing protein [Histomonas meleagridis]KAH0799486.1 Pkinase-domain-containing protein [Histomonas meleagridis]
MPRARCSLLDIKISNPLAIAKIMFRTLEGIEYLHSMSILHGDIKPGNIVLKINDFDDPQPKIIDFGHANKLNSIDHLCRCHAMTYTYSSPELLSLQPHGLESDIWSLGATFFYLITKKELLVLKKIEEMRKDAANIRLSFQEKEWKNYPFSLRALISQMLNKDPNKRPRAEQCLTHQFFIEFLGKEWILREQERIKISKNIV